MPEFEEFFRDLELNPEQPLYVISVVSKIVHLPVWTLRELEKKEGQALSGMVSPSRDGH